MKKIKFFALLMLVGLVSVSCNDILDDNINPDRAHAIDAKDGLPVVIYYAQQIVYVIRTFQQLDKRVSAS